MQQNTKFRVYAENNRLAKQLATILKNKYNAEILTTEDQEHAQASAMDVEATGAVNHLIVCFAYHGGDERAKIKIEEDPAIIKLQAEVKAKKDIIQAILLITCGGSATTYNWEKLQQLPSHAESLCKQFKCPVYSCNGFIELQISSQLNDSKLVPNGEFATWTCTDLSIIIDTPITKSVDAKEIEKLLSQL